MAKLWAGRTAGDTDKLADDFNSSIRFDSRMYREDITGSMAHAAMLGARGIIPQRDAAALIDALQGILDDLESGALAFDISTEKKLRETLGDGLFGEDRDDVTYLWANRYDNKKRTATMDLTFFVRERDGRYRRFDETHVQKAHDPRRLEALLLQCGFTQVRIFGDRTFDAPDADAQRIHMTAVRP